MQLDYIDDPTLDEASELQAFAEVEARGAIFTKRAVVEFILDLVGYRSSADLAGKRILEPSFGDGDFLFPMVDRLLQSVAVAGDSIDVARLRDAIRAVEIHHPTFETTKSKLVKKLIGAGFASEDAVALADAWLIRGDFLLVDIDGCFDFVAGNPPYVRQELIPDALIKEYRRRYSTIFDRADLYVPFYERSLKMLSNGGVLAFICADRWTKNRYGGPLRRLVASGYSLTHHVDMTGVDAFEAEVDAYPAITVLRAGAATAPTTVVRKQGLEVDDLADLLNQLDGTGPDQFEVVDVPSVAVEDEPWLLDHPKRLALARRLESDFPTLEDAGCKVGIGVATGADRVFIADFDDLPVENSRKLPLSMRRDLKDGKVHWQGKGVVNPFNDDGSLVDLADYPMMKAYMEEHGEALRKRNVAKRSPDRWHRTIDRIHNQLTAKPKLLIPDIAGKATIAFDEGGYYPHHNLYYITSDEWDLIALRAVLLSDVTKLFISLYSTKMRGGFLRYQAQYLRRLRLPKWDTLPDSLREKLSTAGSEKAGRQLGPLMAELYGLSETECEILNQMEIETA